MAAAPKVSPLPHLLYYGRGTYYYGACVSHADDANPGNDCSTGIKVMVGMVDMQMESPAVSTALIETGEALTLTFSVVVENTGDVTAASGGTLVYYRSTDDTISNHDTRLDSVTLPAINSGDSIDPKLRDYLTIHCWHLLLWCLCFT